MTIKMTDEQVEAISRKAHWICASNLSPAIMKDPNRDRYWDVMTEEFKQPWRDIVRLVAHEVINNLSASQLGAVIGTGPDGQAIVRYPEGQSTCS
jgi:hypothetical protein